MKLKIEFSKNTEPVPFSYVSNLNGYLHKVLGEDNPYHDDLSLHSTSFLHGGRISSNKKFLNFNNGATWYISSSESKFIEDFVKNVYNHIEFAFGMELLGVEMIEDMLTNDGVYYMFRTMSPVLLKQKDRENNKNIYLTYENDIKTTSDVMKSLILKKAKKALISINPEDFDISFNYEYDQKKIKWISVKKVNNKTSVCPVFVRTAKPEVAKFIYNVGVGHSTGSGFGFLM